MWFIQPYNAFNYSFNAKLSFYVITLWFGFLSLLRDKRPCIMILVVLFSSPPHPHPLPVFSRVRVVQSFSSCVVLCGSLFVFSGFFSSVHYIVYSSFKTSDYTSVYKNYSYLEKNSGFYVFVLHVFQDICVFQNISLATCVWEK